MQKLLTIKEVQLEPDANRIQGYDMARAIAILAMVVVNYTSMMEVSVFPGAWVCSVVDFLYGRAATLFVVLAGVSLSLVVRGHRAGSRRNSIESYLMKRSVLLFITGIALSFWWEADILHFYALFVALGAWISSCSNRALWALTLLAALISIPVCAALTATYDWTDWIPYVEGQMWGIKLLLDYATSRYYSVFPWITYFLMGMLLGRRHRTDRFFLRRCLVISATTCLAIELISAQMMAWAEHAPLEIEGNWWLTFMRSEAFPATPLFMVSSGCGALAIISFCRLVANHHAVVRCLAPVLAFGRLSLTMYVMHLFWGFAVVRWTGHSSGAVNATTMLNAAGVFCCSAICFSACWLQIFKRGPLETLFYQLARISRDQIAAFNPFAAENGSCKIKKV